MEGERDRGRLVAPRRGEVEAGRRRLEKHSFLGGVCFSDKKAMMGMGWVGGGGERAAREEWAVQ